jgi:hypothetical protein
METNEISFKISFDRRQLTVFLAFLLLAWHPGFLGSETLTLTTYYPAPYGGYVSLLTTNQTLLARDGGNVGIQTQSPGSVLHVNGITQVVDPAASADTAAYGTFGVTRPANGNTLSYIAMTRQGNVVKSMGIDASNNWVFGLPQAGTQRITSPQMVITQGGNMGIADSAPAERLTVNGNVSISGDIILNPAQTSSIRNVCTRVYYGIGAQAFCPSNARVMGFTGDGVARVWGFLPLNQTSTGTGRYIVIGEDWAGYMTCCRMN